MKMTVNVFEIKAKGVEPDESYRFDVNRDDDINTQIDEALRTDYGINAESFNWEEVDLLEEVRGVLRKYFEGNDEYDPDFSAQDAIDEISEIVDL